MESFLLHNVLHFTRLLSQLGLRVPAGRALEVVQALEHIDVGRRWDFYHALRSLLVQRPQDLSLFDAAFWMFWRPPGGPPTARDLRPLGRRRRTGPPALDRSTPPRPAVAGMPAPPRTITVDRVAPGSYSAREVLDAKDFSRLTEAELAEAMRRLTRLQWRLGLRRTRRWRPGRGRALDLRHAIRANLEHGGELLALPTRQRRLSRRRLVVVCDVSGSMERYARVLLQFASGLTGQLYRADAFAFATRLTRITPQLRRRGVGRAVAGALRQVPDFAGGTRIGQALGDFNRRWARRVLGHGSVVLVISDGWDRGDPHQLGQEMARLQRATHRLIWLNPLLGAVDYAPLTRGMQAALPFIDDFLPVHNLASLEALAAHLEALPPRRPHRSPRARFAIERGSGR